jgi:hypothetical protein
MLFAGVPLLAFSLAAILSLKSYLLVFHCFTTIVPCVFLAIAHGIASLSTMPRVVTLVFASIYLVSSLHELREVKSNAREAAAVVAARARPTDLILIAPTFAPPFNYYYTLDNPQINYPHEERRGTIPFDDLRARLLDPGPMVRVRARLEQAHREGRRIWFLTRTDTLSDACHARRSLPDDRLDGDRLPESLPLTTFHDVSRLRAIQLHRQLNALYGAPAVIAIPRLGGEHLEAVQVLLYNKGDQSPQVEGSEGHRDRGTQVEGAIAGRDGTSVRGLGGL